MPTPTVYSSADASAPVCTGVSGPIPTLRACLVDGYGAKAGAGWTEAFTGTNKAVFRQGAGLQRYLRLDQSADTRTARVVSYDAMTDVDTGTDPMPTAAQVSGGLYLHGSATLDSVARPWLVIATSSVFYAFFYGSITDLDYPYGEVHLAFGDLLSPTVPSDAKHSFIVGSTSSTMPSGYNATHQALFAFSTSAAATGHYLRATYDQTGDSISIGKWPMQPIRYPGSRSGLSSPSGTVRALANPDALTQGLEISPFLAFQTSTYIGRGVFPGIWFTKHLISIQQLLAGAYYAAPGSALDGRQFRYVWSTSSGSLMIETTDGSW